jgi:hypothetical protein
MKTHPLFPHSFKKRGLGGEFVTLRLIFILSLCYDGNYLRITSLNDSVSSMASFKFKDSFNFAYIPNV